MDRRSDNATSVNVEIDPHCRRLGRSQTDFALQAIVERRAAVAKRIAVLLRWHSEGGVIFVVVYYCRTYMKAVRGGGSKKRGRVLWDATSRGLCGRVGPPRTNVRVSYVCLLL